MITWCYPDLVDKDEWRQDFAEPIMQGKHAGVACSARHRGAAPPARCAFQRSLLAAWQLGLLPAAMALQGSCRTPQTRTGGA